MRRCGDWCKVAAHFSRPFWREIGASGVVQTPGPYSIWWEAGGGQEGGEDAVALVGLGFGQAACEQVATLETENGDQHAANLVQRTLGAIFGEVVERELRKVVTKSWAVDPLTFDGSASRREYGHRLLRQPTPWGVHFAGTETEAHNGHVEGAVAAGERAAREVLELMSTQ